MQRARRWRRVVKWGLLACAVGVLVVVFASGWKWALAVFDLADTRTTIVLKSGVLAVEAVSGRSNLNGARGIKLLDAPHSSWQHMRLEWQRRTSGAVTSTAIEVSLWMFFPLALGPYLLLARADRLAAKRARVGTCPACGYDRAGLAPAVVCPECGKGATSA